MRKSNAYNSLDEAITAAIKAYHAVLDPARKSFGEAMPAVDEAITAAEKSYRKVLGPVRQAARGGQITTEKEVER